MDSAADDRGVRLEIVLYPWPCFYSREVSQYPDLRLKETAKAKPKTKEEKETGLCEILLAAPVKSVQIPFWRCRCQ
jgi:hypothetical protein